MSSLVTYESGSEDDGGVAGHVEAAVKPEEGGNVKAETVENRGESDCIGDSLNLSNGSL